MIIALLILLLLAAPARAQVCAIITTTVGWTWSCPQFGAASYGSVAKDKAEDGTLYLTSGHATTDATITAKYGGRTQAALAIGGPNGRLVNEGITSAGQYSYQYASSYPTNGIPYEPTEDMGLYAQQDRAPFHLKNQVYLPNPGAMTCNNSSYYNGETPEDFDPTAQAAYNGLWGTGFGTSIYEAAKVAQVRDYIPDDGDSLFVYDSVPTHPDFAYILAAMPPFQTISDPIWSGGAYKFPNSTKYTKIGETDYLAGKYGCLGASTLISALSEQSYIVTATVSNSFTAGEMVVISGASPAGYNNNGYPVLVLKQGLSANGFQYVITIKGLANAGSGATVAPVASPLVTTGTDPIGLPTCGATLIASSLAAFKTAWNVPSITTWGTSDANGLAGIAVAGGNSLCTAAAAPYACCTGVGTGTCAPYASYGTGTGFLDEAGSHIIGTFGNTCINPPSYSDTWGNNATVRNDTRQFVGLDAALHAARQRMGYASQCSSHCPPLGDLYYDSPTEAYQQASPWLDLMVVSPHYYTTQASVVARMQTIVNATGDQPIRSHNYGGVYKPDWAKSTLYATNALIEPVTANTGQFIFTATVGGTSGSSEPTWPQTSGNTVVDSGVTWTNLGTIGNSCFQDAINHIGANVFECQLTESAEGTAEANYEAAVLRLKNTMGHFAIVGYGHWMYSDWNNGSSTGPTSIIDNQYDGSQASTISTCTATWVANNLYTTPTCITDGTNQEWLSIAGEPGATCTSKTGSPPTWKTAYGAQTTDGGCTWFNGQNYPILAETSNSGNALLPLVAFWTSNLADPTSGIQGTNVRGSGVW